MEFINNFRLKILTPNGIFFDDNVNIVSLKTTEGNIGILHGHIPLVASIAVSKLNINDNLKEQECAISGGLLCVEPDRVTIITDAIEKKTEIDLSRAKRAEIVAKRILDKKNLEPRVEFSARYSLLKALNRIKLKEKRNG